MPALRTFTQHFHIPTVALTRQQVGMLHASAGGGLPGGKAAAARASGDLGHACANTMEMCVSAFHASTSGKPNE
jgi:hypothetical protein